MTRNHKVEIQVITGAQDPGNELTAGRPEQGSQPHLPTASAGPPVQPRPPRDLVPTSPQAKFLSVVRQPSHGLTPRKDSEMKHKLPRKIQEK